MKKKKVRWLLWALITAFLLAVVWLITPRNVEGLYSSRLIEYMSADNEAYLYFGDGEIIALNVFRS